MTASEARKLTDNTIAKQLENRKAFDKQIISEIEKDIMETANLGGYFVTVPDDKWSATIRKHFVNLGYTTEHNWLTLITLEIKNEYIIKW